MKKLAILVGAIALTSSTFAQSTWDSEKKKDKSKDKSTTSTSGPKATMDNPFSLEGAMNINTGNGVAWQSPSIRARYFVTENIAVRAELGLGDGMGTPLSSTEEFSKWTPGNSTSNVDSTDNPMGTRVVKNFAWNAQVGAEYHLGGTDRISPYFMLGINFGGGSLTETWDESDGSSYVEGLDAEVTGKMSMFGVGVGAGLDVYIIDNLYVGLELGLNFASYNYKDMTTTVTNTIAGVSTTTNSAGDNYKESYLSTGAGNAAIRLGWRF